MSFLGLKLKLEVGVEPWTKRCDHSRHHPLAPAQTCEGPGLVGGHSPEVAQVALVAHKHDHNVVVGVVSQLLQPALHVLVGEVFGNVIDKQSPNSTTVVSESMRHSPSARALSQPHQQTGHLALL